MFKIIILLSLMTFSIFDSLVQAEDGLFASPEEKAYLLELAGMDGQIDRQEWENRDKSRTSLKALDWEFFDIFDMDENGTISMNEFCKFLEARRKSAWTDNLDTKDDALERATLATLSDLSEGDFGKSVSFDRNILFRRAQIARRTKFQKISDPLEELQLYKHRNEQLKDLETRRRFAARQQPTRTNRDDEMIRDLYRSKLVKYRISQSSPTGESSTRKAVRDKYRHASQEDDLSKRRALLNEKMSRSSQSITPPPLRPSQIRQSQNNSRGTSDIRGLIPGSRTSRSGSNPSDTETQGKTKSKRSNLNPNLNR